MVSLDDLANKYGTDKGTLYPHQSRHGYAPIYDQYLNRWRNDPIRLLEIGICMESTAGGHSIHMWREYFPNAEMFGFDIVDMKHLENHVNNLKIFQGDQNNREDLKKMYLSFGEKPFDFILEDGSHVHEHQMVSFAHLFKYVKSGGLYILEDMTEKNIPACCIRNDDSYDVIQNFIKTGKIESSFITKEESDYIEKNVIYIDIFPDIQNAYRVAIIHKK